MDTENGGLLTQHRKMLQGKSTDFGGPSPPQRWGRLQPANPRPKVKFTPTHEMGINEPPRVSRLANRVPSAGLPSQVLGSPGQGLAPSSFGSFGVPSGSEGQRKGGQGQVERTCNHDLDLPQEGPRASVRNRFTSPAMQLSYAGARLGLPLLCIQHNEGTL